MSQLITNPQPKVRYQQFKDAVEHHRTLVANEVFTRAIDFALLQYQNALTTTMTPNFDGAAGAGMRLLGAQEFVTILRNLSETPTPAAKVTPSPNLDHRH